MPVWIRYLAWVWMIIVGGLLIVPGWPPICIACGRATITTPEYVLGGVSVILGLAGLVSEFRAKAQ